MTVPVPVGRIADFTASADGSRSCCLVPEDVARWMNPRTIAALEATPGQVSHGSTWLVGEKAYADWSHDRPDLLFVVRVYQPVSQPRARWHG